MSDYISRQAAIDVIEEHIKARLDWVTDSRLERQGLNAAMCAIEDMPSADVVEVVRCGECKHMTEDGRCLEFADDCLRPSASDYCSYGERKE